MLDYVRVVNFLIIITKAKVKDVNFMIKAKDLFFPNVKAKNTVSSRTFQGLLLITQCFIILYTVYIHIM